MAERNIWAIVLVGLMLGSVITYFVVPVLDAFPPMSQNILYKFQDNSICPCKSGHFISLKECNEEVNRLFTMGYKEVEYCEPEQKGEE